MGFAAALFTGGAVHFQEGTSYLVDTVVKTWDDIDRLRFDPDSRWAQYALAFWRGVAAEYVEGSAVTPHVYRSPLDLANDLRGNGIFEDMYNEPEEVEHLVGKCTDMIIEVDRHYRSEIPLLREAPGGAWDLALPAPGLLMVNGDPVDLISPEMGERFNNPSIERLADYAGSVYFHHHTLGVSRVSSVAKTRGLTVQQFTPDPKCPRVYDLLDDTWVEASNRVPIDIWQNLLESPDVDAPPTRCGTADSSSTSALERWTNAGDLWNASGDWISETAFPKRGQSTGFTVHGGRAHFGSDRNKLDGLKFTRSKGIAVTH